MTQGYTKGVPIDTDATLGTDSDQLVPSQKAVKTYVDVTIAGNALPVTATANQVLLSQSLAAPVWSTATFPGTATNANRFLQADGTNWTESSETLILGGNFEMSGAFTFTGTVTGNTAVTYPTSGTLATLAGTETFTNKTIDANGTGNSISNIDVEDLANGTDGELITWDAAGVPTTVGAGSAGQVLVSQGAGSVPVFQDVSESFTWAGVAGTSQSAAVNTAYVIQNASQTTVTLPATAALGDRVIVQGLGAGGWILAAAAGDTIQVGSSATTSGGTVTSDNQWDSIQVVCLVANTTWGVVSLISAGVTVA